MDLGITNLATLLGLLRHDTVPECRHALLALCAPADLDTVQNSATHLGNLCRLRARELFLVAAHMAGVVPTDRAHVVRLLDHAATALEEAEYWSTLAASALHIQHHPELTRQAARAIAAGWPTPRRAGD